MILKSKKIEESIETFSCSIRHIYLDVLWANLGTVPVDICKNSLKYQCIMSNQQCFSKKDKFMKERNQKLHQLFCGLLCKVFVKMRDKYEKRCNFLDIFLSLG
jgi:hypothetical protein